jgi:hypothetical protein
MMPQLYRTVVLDGKPMISTANCTNTAGHTAALWSPILFSEGGYWHITYVGYDCGRGYSNANTDGQIKLAKSTLIGDAGIAGPFVRCAFSDRILHSRMPLDPTHVRLK